MRLGLKNNNNNKINNSSKCQLCSEVYFMILLEEEGRKGQHCDTRSDSVIKKYWFIRTVCTKPNQLHMKSSTRGSFSKSYASKRSLMPSSSPRLSR